MRMPILYLVSPERIVLETVHSNEMKFAAGRPHIAALFLLLFTLLPFASSQPPARQTSVPLIPIPRESTFGSAISVSAGVTIAVPAADPDDLFAAASLADGLRERGVTAATSNPSASGIAITLLRTSSPQATSLLNSNHLAFTPEMQAEGYVIVPDHTGLAIIGSTSAGVFYGAQTARQLVFRGQLHPAIIRDWPALPHRGIDDDLSRGPVPTLDYQKFQIRTLAAYKINIYSPYFEHTLTHAASSVAAPPGGAMTADDVAELVRYAAPYHVTILPEQEAFGHLHHVLKYDLYSSLSETAHGNVLAPGQPGSLALTQAWFTEIATQFPSPWMHIGADETQDLGRGQTRADVTARGLPAVYIDYLRRVHDALAPLHKQLLFWGDIAMKDPALVKSLPQDMIAVPWWYDPQPKGFDHFIRPFIDAGMETWVAPGVNNWRRVYPDNQMALENIQGFIRDGQRLGVKGALTTVWNDDGDSLFDQDWYGVLFGAAASWQPGESSIPQYQSSFGPVFHNDFTGSINEAQQELISAHLAIKSSGLPPAMSDGRNTLFWLDPFSPEGIAVTAKLAPAARDLRIHAENAIRLIQQARAGNRGNTGGLGPLVNSNALEAMELGARRLDLIGMKFEYAQEFQSTYATLYATQNDKTQRIEILTALGDITGANGKCQDLRDAYTLTRDLFSQSWLRENRPYWLGNVVARYDLATQYWIQRGDRFSEIQSAFRSTGILPSPETAGLSLSTDNARAAPAKKPPAKSALKKRSAPKKKRR